MDDVHCMVSNGPFSAKGNQALTFLASFLDSLVVFDHDAELTNYLWSPVMKYLDLYSSCDLMLAQVQGRRIA